MQNTTLIVLVLVLALIAGSTARAEIEVDPFDLTFDELVELSIVNVASLFEESELVVGSTVEVITRDKWRQYGARTLTDALSHSPGIVVLPSFFGGSHLGIRGYALSGHTGVAYNLDGIPINGIDLGNALLEGNSLQLGVLDRIEIVRGPGSSIYGQDAFHGVVSLEVYEAQVDDVTFEGSVGGDRYRQITARASHGLTGHVRYSAAVSYNAQPDQGLTYRYTDPDTTLQRTGERANEFDGLMATLKVHSDPNARVAWRVGAYVNNQTRDDFAGAGTLQSSGMSILRNRDLSSGESDLTLVSGALKFNLDRDISIEADAFHWHAERIRDLDRTAQLPPPPFAPFFISVDNNVERQGLNLVIKQPTNTWNTQWAVGMSYDEGDVTKHFQRLFTPAGALFRTAPGAQAGTTRSTKSLFAQARTTMLDGKLHLLYGGRIDDFSDFGVETSPRLGLIVQPTESTSLKLLYGQAFRPSNAGEIAGSPAIMGDPSLPPETIDTLELAFIRHFTSGSVNVTLFRSEWEDAIVIVPLSGVPPFVARRANVGANSATGVEITTKFVLDEWKLDFSSSYARAEDELGHVTLDAFPEWIINLGIGWTPSPSFDVYLSNRTHLGADEGEVVINPATGQLDISPDELPTYFRTDLNVTWHADEGLDVYLQLLNVFDRDNAHVSTLNAENGVPDNGFAAELGLRWTR